MFSVLMELIGSQNYRFLSIIENNTDLLERTVLLFTSVSYLMLKLGGHDCWHAIFRVLDHLKFISFCQYGSRMNHRICPADKTGPTCMAQTSEQVGE